MLPIFPSVLNFMTKNSFPESTVHTTKLFRPKPWSESENTVLNWHGNPEKEFHMYALAFKEAARSLARRKRIDGFFDFHAFPILFLYRQALELYFKAILLGDGAEILRNAGKPCPTRTEILGANHSLEKLLPNIRLVFQTVGWENDWKIKGLNGFDDFEKIVQEFSKFDPLSQASRYPIKKDGTAWIPGHFTFNLKEASRTLNKVLGILDGAITALHEYLANYYEGLQYSDGFQSKE
jgi:hypothetical protein